MTSTNGIKETPTGEILHLVHTVRVYLENIFGSKPKPLTQVIEDLQKYFKSVRGYEREQLEVYCDMPSSEQFMYIYFYRHETNQEREERLQLALDHANEELAIAMYKRDEIEQMLKYNK